MKETQRWYRMSLTEGIIDQAYHENRIRIGAVHSRIGLTTDWYLGTYMTYLNIATNVLQRVIPEQWHHTSQSQDKTHTLLGELREELEGITEMGSLIRGFSDQTHLLGFKLTSVRSESEHTSTEARNQAASSQELASFVQMVDKVTKDLQRLNP